MKMLRILHSLCAFCALVGPFSAFADNTPYILAARQGNLFKAQERISDLVANANTTGFKSEKDVFATYPVRIRRGETVAFTNIPTTVRSTAQGNLVSTGRALDVAINGKGYFMVRSPQGTFFTRAGNFKTNEEGVLVTQDNYPVIGSGGGQVEFAEGDNEISILEDGTVRAGVEDRGIIGVFAFEDEQDLERVSGNYLRSPNDPQVSEEYQLVQGMLENSNVNSVTAMTDLIAVSRAIDGTAEQQKNYHNMQMNVIRTLSGR